MLLHEFLTIPIIPGGIPLKAFNEVRMIRISDDFINKSYESINKVKMYNPIRDEYIYGLAYSGITVLDPQMAAKLKAELLSYFDESECCRMLITLLSKAVEKNMYIIHFGI